MYLTPSDVVQGGVFTSVTVGVLGTYTLNYTTLSKTSTLIRFLGLYAANGTK